MGKYNFELDMTTNNSVSMIAKKVGRGSEVLEIGSAHGRLTKYLHDELECEVDIVEIDYTAGNDAKKYARTAFIGKQGDVEKKNWYEGVKTKKYDYIILADVLEHLKNPQEVLNKCSSLLKENGSILLSVPNVANTDVLINLINNRFSYKETGLLDNTHIHFYTYYAIKEELSNAGLQIIDELATFCPWGYAGVDADYDSVSREMRRELSKREYGNVYQFIFEAKKVNEGQKVNITILKDEKQSFYCSKFYFLQQDAEQYSEADCKVIRINPCQGDYLLETELSDKSDFREVRFDPLNVNCIYRLNSMYAYLNEERVDLDPICVVGTKMTDNIMVCGSDDPYIIFDIHCKNYDKICIDFSIIDFDNQLIRILEEKLLLDNNLFWKQELDKLKLTIIEKDKHIEEIEQIIIEKDKHIEEIEQRIIEKDKSIGEFDWKIKSLEQYIPALESEKMRLEESVIRLEKHKELLEQQVVIRAQMDACFDKVMTCLSSIEQKQSDNIINEGKYCESIIEKIESLERFAIDSEQDFKKMQEENFFRVEERYDVVSERMEMLEKNVQNNSRYIRAINKTNWKQKN